jgi:hypothetical protein
MGRNAKLGVIALLMLAMGCSCGKQKAATVTVHTDKGGLSEYINLPDGTVEVYWFRFAQPISKDPSTGSRLVVGPTDYGTMAIIILQPEKYEAYLKTCELRTKPEDDPIIAKYYIGNEFKSRLEGKTLQYDKASDTYRIHADERYTPTPSLKSPAYGGTMIPLRDKNIVLIIARH